MLSKDNVVIECFSEICYLLAKPPLIFCALYLSSETPTERRTQAIEGLPSTGQTQGQRQGQRQRQSNDQTLPIRRDNELQRVLGRSDAGSGQTRRRRARGRPFGYAESRRVR